MSLSGDTIFALSTGRLPSGIAIIRLSGTSARFGLETVFGRVPSPRLAAYGRFFDEIGKQLDSGLALYFPGPVSFTGEDCAEFHLHGGRAVVAAMLARLGRLPGFRLAEPGEFTRRAFFNGKVDLTGAEALADLVAAETESQRQFALFNAGGAQRDNYDAWRLRLLHARAMIEAELDFSDQEDVPGAVADRVWGDLGRLQTEIDRHIEGFSRAEMVREGVRVVLAGAPNSGKSSLLNALARRDVAIVSDEPGTTRDVVEASLDLDGIKVVLQDTAGIRAGAGAVEAAGIARTLQRAAQAHLILTLEDTSNPIEMNFDPGNVPVLSIGTKIDLPGRRVGYDQCLSVVEDRGVDELLARVARFAREAAAIGEETLPSRLRHIQHLTMCRNELAVALEAARIDLEVRAEHLREAASSLGRIVGQVDVEELLGSIFAQFCIGK